MITHPKLLFVNPGGMNSATFSGLFGGWPDERIRFVSLGTFSGHATSLAQDWHLEGDSFPVDTMFRKLWRALTPKYEGNSHPVPEKRSGVQAVESTLHEFVRGALDASPVSLSASFWNWVEEYRPDVVYSVLNSIRVIKIVNEISSRIGCPVVPHYMDDWPSTLYALTPGVAIWRQILYRHLGKLQTRAPIGLAISEPMANEYQRRFGKTFRAFMNAVDVPEKIPERAAISKTTFVYIGGLHLNRWQGLHEIGKSLADLANEGLSAELTVYAPKADFEVYQTQMLVPGFLRYGGELKQSQMRDVLAEVDVAVHVESFDENIRKYARLSVSTKIPQYLAMGCPVIAYAPGDLASTEYISRNKAGLAVTQQDIGQLKKTLRLIIQDRSLRSSLGANGWRLANANHNITTQRTRFRETLLEASTRST